MPSTKTDQNVSESHIIGGNVRKPSGIGIERTGVTEIGTEIKGAVSFNIVEKLTSSDRPSSHPPVKRCNENLRGINPITSKFEYQLDQPKHTLTKGISTKDGSSTATTTSAEKSKGIIFVIQYYTSLNQ